MHDYVYIYISIYIYIYICICMHWEQLGRDFDESLFPGSMEGRGHGHASFA